MSEDVHADKATNVYAIVCDPLQITSPQHFHCEESKSHRRFAHRMPPALEDWLISFVDVIDDQTKQQEHAKK